VMNFDGANRNNIFNADCTMDMKQSSFSVQDSRSETVDQSYVFKKRRRAPLLEGLQALN
jgi:hypothetical protein